ncbi:hypothetical protein F5Y11DRAFT_335006 [Daldinia sp. FL1419]|nr:hypothetical protein F5Y11DRAFT_335006 [Daldinia sp. FL1419]
MMGRPCVILWLISSPYCLLANAILTEGDSMTLVWNWLIIQLYFAPARLNFLNMLSRKALFI